jgi:hypothetical protein
MRPCWPQGPSKNIDEAEYPSREWAGWHNNPLLPGPIGDITPAEFEPAWYKQKTLTRWLPDSQKRIFGVPAVVHIVPYLDHRF